MEIRDDEIFGNRNIKYHKCWNCGARLVWDNLNNRWVCQLCGATD